MNYEILNKNYLDSHTVEKIFSGNSLDIKDIPSWFSEASLSRTQRDLIATSPNEEKIEFIDYFTNFELPSIYTQNGLFFRGSLIEILAGPLTLGKYAQAAIQQDLSIGEVSSVSGSAKATRIDGTTFDLSTGDPVFQGDKIEVSSSGAVGLVFLDKTTLSLSEGGKMVLDELVYDPSSGTGSMAVDMVEGAFSFVSGEIAKTGPDAMQVSTPVATIGIRGTTVAGKAALEGNENSFTLLQDADGGVGQISVSNDGGTQVLAQVGATTSIASFTAPPPPPIILSAAQIQANYGTALNVLPPTPVVAPTPQPPPPPQEQQQEQVQEEESQQEEEAVEEEAVEEELQEEGEGPPEGEEGEGPPEGEEGEGLPEGEGPPEGEEGPPIGPDGEPLAEEGPPEGEGPPVGPDGESLAEGEGGPPIGPDGEPLPPGEGGPPIGPDGEPLPPGDFGPGGPPVGPDGEPLADGPPIGPDGEPLPPGDFGPGGPSPEQDAAAREAFETALAAGLSPEEAMAEAAAAAGIPSPPGGFGEDPLSATVGGDEFAGGPLGPGGVGDFGPGGPGDFGPGGPGDIGPGGPGDFGPGGPGDFGPGDSPVDFGPGGPVDFGPGGPVDFGPGGPVDFNPGGPGLPGGPGIPDAPGGPGLPGDPAISGGPVPVSAPIGTFLPPGSFLPPGTIQQPGAYIPAGVDGFAPIAPVTTAPVPGTGFAGGTDDGGFHSGSGSRGSFDQGPGGGPEDTGPGGGPADFGPGGPMAMDFGPGGPGDFGPAGFGPVGFGPVGFGPAGFGPGGPGDFGPAGFGPVGFGPAGFGPGGPGGFVPGGFGPGGFGPGGFDPYGPDPIGGVPAENFYYEDPSMFENIGEAESSESGNGSGSGSGSGSSGSSTTFVGTSAADSEDKSAESDAWKFEGYDGADIFKGGSGNDVFWGALGNDTLTGNAGQDIFYFQDFTEGKDTISDFVVGASGDALKFGGSFTSAYTRDSTLVDDNGSTGTTYNMATNSNVLPKIFNFTDAFATAGSTSGVISQLTSFVVTTDGTNPISSSADFIVITSTTNDSFVYGWGDSGNGSIDNGELFTLATLTGVDNDSMTASNFAFGSI